MNILIKLTCLVGLVIAPILGGHSHEAQPTPEATEAAAPVITIDATDAPDVVTTDTTAAE
jgi:K(+)-stimulated pyrophosphate-energized sodium pump